MKTIKKAYFGFGAWSITDLGFRVNMAAALAAMYLAAFLGR